MNFDNHYDSGKIKGVKALMEKHLNWFSPLAILVGAVGWFSSLASETHSNTATLIGIKDQQAEYNKDLQTIREAVVRIDEQLRERKRK